MTPELQAALFFLSEDDIASIAPFGAGNINDTFTLTKHSGEQEILQRLNPCVFPDLHAVMLNMQTVLEHLQKETCRERTWKNFTFLSLFRGKTGDRWFEDADGSVWRLMNMVANSRTYRSIQNPNQAEQLGRGLGFFHRMLRNLDPGKLLDTLPHIHNTARYLRQYEKKAIHRQSAENAETRLCDSFIKKNRHLSTQLEADLQELSRSVIHGDPKVDNFLFDLSGKNVVSIIDLDTVKPGLLLHDLGDALRSCCNTGGETLKKPEKVFFDPDIFHAWLSGYFAEAHSLLNARDRSHIIDSVLIIAFELGLRFYTDYVDGNRYFKVNFPEENLHRALVQFHLAESIKKQTSHLNSVVREVSLRR